MSKVMKVSIVIVIAALMAALVGVSIWAVTGGSSDNVSSRDVSSAAVARGTVKGKDAAEARYPDGVAILELSGIIPDGGVITVEMARIAESLGGNICEILELSPTPEFAADAIVTIAHESDLGFDDSISLSAAGIVVTCPEYTGWFAGSSTI